MSRSTIDNLINNFTEEFPMIADRSVDYILVNGDELLITLQDGTCISYSDANGSIRKVPNRSGCDEEDFKREFAIRLRNLMRKNRVTQSELSRLTGISTVSLSNYITGKTTPSFYNVILIAKALQCCLEDFWCL